MNTATCSDVIHRFELGADAQRAPLLMLHGTGGNEDDLLPLGRMIAPGASLISPQGQVLKGGMPRFFRRLGEGVFDEDDLKLRTDDLAGFIAEARERYGVAAPIAVGFSNGANIAASLMLRHPAVLAGAVLLRAMPPYADPPQSDLAGAPVPMLSGALDPIVGEALATRLEHQLVAAGADVTHRMLPAGHGLSQADITLATGWLAQRR